MPTLTILLLLFADSASRAAEISAFNDRYPLPIFGPIAAGGAPVKLDPPTPDEVLEYLDYYNPDGDVSHLYKRTRNLLRRLSRRNVRVSFEPIGDYADPPRSFPEIGRAQQYHDQYKFTVNSADLWGEENPPLGGFIDHNQLHLIAPDDEQPAAQGRRE